jgi:hypothetical protein
MKKIAALSFSGFCLLVGLGCFIDPSSDTKKVKDIKFMSFSSLPDAYKPKGYNFNYVYPPNFSLSSGSYSSDITVEIKADSVGAIIHYTMNGDDPTESSPVYLNPIAISGNGTFVTIKAIAIKASGEKSNISKATYQINWLKCSVPNFDPPSGAFTGTQVISIASDVGATIQYTTDGSDPKTSSSTIMGSSVNVDYCMTVRACAHLPGMLDSDTSSANFSLVQDLGYASKGHIDIVRSCLGPDNKPIILCRDNYSIYRIYKWNSGTSWDDLGYFAGISDGFMRIAVGSDNIPIVAYIDNSNNYRGHIFKWNTGTSWTDLGFVGNYPVNYIAITAGSDSRPIIAFDEMKSGNWGVRVMKWDLGTSWIDYGIVLKTLADDFTIVSGADNKPVITILDSDDNYRAHVLKWDSGTQWLDLSYTGGAVYDIAVCQDNLLIVMSNDWPNGKSYVMKYTSSGVWADMGFLDINRVYEVSLLSDKYCNPIVASYTFDGFIQLWKWDSGTTWKNKGPALCGYYDYSMFTDEDGLPVIAYVEGNNYWLRVKRFIIR